MKEINSGTLKKMYKQYISHHYYRAQKFDVNKTSKYNNRNRDELLKNARGIYEEILLEE